MGAHLARRHTAAQRARLYRVPWVSDTLALLSPADDKDAPALYINASAGVCENERAAKKLTHQPGQSSC